MTTLANLDLVIIWKPIAAIVLMAAMLAPALVADLRLRVRRPRSPRPLR